MEQLVARQAHNLEVARSNPASATSKNATAFFFRFKAVSERAPGRRSSQSEASLRAERESCLQIKNKISDRQDITPRQSDYQSCK